MINNGHVNFMSWHNDHLPEVLGDDSCSTFSVHSIFFNRCPSGHSQGLFKIAVSVKHFSASLFKSNWMLLSISCFVCLTLYLAIFSASLSSDNSALLDRAVVLIASLAVSKSAEKHNQLAYTYGVIDYIQICCIEIMN